MVSDWKEAGPEQQIMQSFIAKAKLYIMCEIHEFFFFISKLLLEAANCYHNSNVCVKLFFLLIFAQLKWLHPQLPVLYWGNVSLKTKSKD